ncbi:unnamed protein product [Pieris brassicae]|uniref:Integrase zinc-binding domain-containing protein n=1 Tax=Pieris brassicae TaxID=7116 RepID=A0A9P0TIN9_PIEBR|nr:unnamed protein product [Pieris brassicae]
MTDTTQKRKEMKERFNARIRELTSTKGQNTQILSKKAYQETIEKVKWTKKKTSSKKPEDYQRLKRYDVLTIGNIEKLIVPVKQTDLIKFYVHTEEVFQIIDETHISMSHAGRNKMSTELHSRFKNITREMINIYIELCETCQKKPSSGLKTKHANSQDCTTRCQVEIIGMEPDNGYTNILIYQDLATKFIQLRPLKTQSVIEIADVLLDIFTIFGAPCILQNSVSKELADNIVKQLYITWPQLKMVHGPETEAYELVSDVTKRLKIWLGGNTKKWTEGLRFVQLLKNSDDSSDKSAFEAMFGIKARIGLKPRLPEYMLPNINTEEDLETFLTAGEVPVSVPESHDDMKYEDNRINIVLPGPSHDQLGFDNMDIKIEDTVMKMDHDALDELS